MNSFISKRETNIYRLNSVFLIALIILSPLATAQTNALDMYSFCFGAAVDLGQVKKSLSVLLLPRDVVELREEDHCIDIVCSPDRAKLFEKYLSKRYDLKKDARPGFGESSSREVLANNSCTIEFKTTKKIIKEMKNFKVGSKSGIKNSQEKATETSSMDLVLGSGVEGEISATPDSLNVICHPVEVGDRANLIFAFTQKDKARVKTEVLLGRGEWLNVASIVKELNDKLKTLGIPQTEVSEAVGVENTIYEIRYK
jgi:hypothetical protein